MLKKLDMVIPTELLGLSDIQIQAIYLRDNRDLLIQVESTKQETKCRKCGEICKPHGHDRAMELRHLPVLGYRTFIQLRGSGATNVQETKVLNRVYFKQQFQITPQ